MGMSTIAIREIAKNNGNKEQLSRVFSSLFILNTISTFIVLVILFLSIYLVPTLYQYRELMYVGAFKFLFNYLLIEWFYKGIEEFKYITQRTIFLRCIYVLLIFVFVRERDDYDIYYIISVLIIVINAIINLIYSKRFIHFSCKNISLSSYLGSFFILGLYSLLTSMYTSFNVAYLGFVSGEKEVGYYTTAIKLYTVLLSLFTAFTGVMMPRMSALVAEKRYAEFKHFTEISINVLLIFTMPIIVLSLAFTPQIITFIAGSEYINAVLPMRIVMPLMLIIGYEQIIIVQILMPLQKDKAVMINSILGALVGISMNLLLVSTLKSVGSALVWFSAEIVVLCSGQYFVTKYVRFVFPYKKIIHHILLAIPIFILCYSISILDICSSLILIIGTISVVLYYGFIDILILKDENVISLIVKLKKKLSRCE